MATPMLPINPQRASDEFYRYKMPAIQVKVEGSGNGIKTVLPNIHDICVAINRPEEALMKHFQFDLGAQSTVFLKDDKFLLMGSHTAQRMQESLYDFIKRFVLCRHCHNPQTTIVLPKKRGVGVVLLVCNACGSRGRLADHRVLQAMEQMFKKNPGRCRGIKSAADEKASTQTTQDAAAETEAKDTSAVASATNELSTQQSNNAQNADVLPVSSSSTTAAAAAAATTTTTATGATASTNVTKDTTGSSNVNVSSGAVQQVAKSRPSRRVEKTSAQIGDVRQHPTMALLRFLKECGIDTNAKSVDQSDMDTLISKLIRLMNEYLLQERVGPIIIFEALEQEHSKDFFATVKTFSGLFRRFTTVSELYENVNASERELTQLHERERKIQISFLKYCAKHMQKTYDVERIAVFIFLLFIEGICKPRYIAQWQNDLQKHSLDATYKANLKNKLAPIIKWLDVQLMSGNADNNANSNSNDNEDASANDQGNKDSASNTKGGNADNDNDHSGKKKSGAKPGKAPRAKARSAKV